MSSTKDSRRRLRQKALQAIVSMEFGRDANEAVAFAYSYGKKETDDASGDIPLFLLNLVLGVQGHKAELDEQLSSYLKSGWTLDRLTTIDRNIMRLGLFEIRYFEETPDRVAINEAIELAKTFSDDASVKLVNGVLTRFVTD